jgi:hypothetical protein
MAEREKIIVPFSMPWRQVPRCTQTKSTLLASSVLSLRQRDLFEKYRRHLPEGMEERIVMTPAGVWVPVEVSEAHYAACDALGLSTQNILEIGRSVHEHTQRSVLAISLRVAREGGVTPWLVLRMIPKLWSRLFVGGETQIVELGPKDARIDIAGAPLAQFGYWRTGLRGIVTGILEPFAQRVYVREPRYHPNDNDLLTYGVAWA